MCFFFPYHNEKKVINKTERILPIFFSQASRIAVIPGKTGKVFYHNTVDFPAHYIGQEPLKIFAVGIRSCVSIVHIFKNVFKFLQVLFEQVTLVLHAVVIVFPFF